MKNIVRYGALALSLVGGAALMAAPVATAKADSVQRDGYFGGTWQPIGPRDNRHVKRYDRRHGYYRGYYGPRYGYYGPPRYRYGYYDAPYYYDPGPSFGIYIR